MKILAAIPQKHFYNGSTLSGLCSAAIQLAEAVNKCEGYEMSILQSEPYEFADKHIKVLTYRKNRMIATVKDLAKDYDLVIIHCLQSTLASIADKFEEPQYSGKIIAYLHASFAVGGMTAYFSLDGITKFFNSHITIISPHISACVDEGIKYCRDNGRIVDSSHLKTFEIKNVVKNPKEGVSNLARKNQVIIASRMDSLKNTVEDLKVAISLADMNPGCKILITGGNDLGTINAKHVQSGNAFLLDLLSKRCDIICLGLISNEELRIHLSESKLLIHLSLAETHSLAATEAYSVGTPVLGLQNTLARLYGDSCLLVDTVDYSKNYLKMAESISKEYILRMYSYRFEESRVVKDYCDLFQKLSKRK